MLTESSIVPCTIFNFECLSVHMEILAVAIVTLPKLLEEVARGHLCHVIFVKELTIVSLLAQMPEPMFTNNSPFSFHVTEWTVSSTDTGTNKVILTLGGFVLCTKGTELTLNYKVTYIQYQFSTVHCAHVLNAWPQQRKIESINTHTVHSGEGQRSGSQLFIQGILNFKTVVIHSSYYLLQHCR